MRTVAFGKIVTEASAMYPRTRIWASRTLRAGSRAADTHHGWSHAREVRSLARTIARAEGILAQRAYPLMSTVALLHDVADKKADPDEQYKRSLDRFLRRNASPGLYQFLIDCIIRISMSNEVAYGSADWVQVLGPSGLLIRHYVSDADKLLCLGVQGHARIVQFNIDKILRRHMEVALDAPIPLSADKLSATYISELEREVSAVMGARMQYVPRFLRTRYAQSRGEALTRDLFDRHETWKEEMRNRT